MIQPAARRLVPQTGFLVPCRTGIYTDPTYRHVCLSQLHLLHFGSRADSTTSGADSRKPGPDSISSLELYKYSLEIYNSSLDLYKYRRELYISSLYFKSTLRLGESRPHPDSPSRVSVYVKGNKSLRTAFAESLLRMIFSMETTRSYPKTLRPDLSYIGDSCLSWAYAL